MKRPIGFFLVAGFAAMLAALVVYSSLRRRDLEYQRALTHSVQIVVAAHDLSLGAKITPDSLKLQRWAKDSLPPGSCIDPASLLDRYVKSSLVANEPIIEGKLFSNERTAGVMPLLIPAGMRAMSVPVDEVSDIAGFVLPHSRVDVLVALSGAEGNKAFSKLVLQNVEVLAVAQEMEGKKDEPQVVKVVTLVVTPEEAERLTLASHEGSLRLAMRNYTDSKIVLTKGVDIQDMIHAYSNVPPEPPIMRGQVALRGEPRRPLPFEVEILRNGKTSEAISFINGAEMSSADTGAVKPTPAKAQKTASAKMKAKDAELPEEITGAKDTLSERPASASAEPAPAAPSASSMTAEAPEASFAPIPKTIDVP